MFPIVDVPSFAVLPLSWVGYKRRPTQFNSRKNTPGYGRFNTLTEVNAAILGTTLSEEPATTPAPEETNDGDFKQILVVDSPIDEVLRSALPSSPEAGLLEVPELPKQE